MMVLTQKFYCIFPYYHTTTGENLKMIVYFSLELWFFKVVKLDVCGRLVLSHSVTYMIAQEIAEACEMEAFKLNFSKQRVFNL